ncbi:MAG: hypothetical protein J5806_02580 [Lentisphaeria bacterium]|nr:hypothetical protein [Lentisphaeria bacterium]
MKKWLWTVLFVAAVMLPASGDDFEDFIQTCARLSANYNRAIQSPDTRFDKEYRANLEQAQRLSRNVQQVIRRLGLGQDFNFPMLIDEVVLIYQARSGRSTIKGSAKLHSHSESPESMLRVLTDDVKALRKMEFTTEDGGSIKASLETRRKLSEFRRLYDFFRTNYRSVRRNPQKKDASLQRVFTQRLSRMSALANVLMDISKRKYPGSVARLNLQTETHKLIQNFEAWCSIDLGKNTKNNSSSRNSRSSRPKNPKHTHRIDGMNSPSALRSEMDISLRNINELLIQWENSGFQSDDPFGSKARPSSGGDPDDPAAPLRQESGRTDYASMSQTQLDELLQKRREAIIRSNRSMDGFDRDAERLYLLTLSQEQRRAYNASLREYQKQGYSSGHAVRSAVLKMQTVMKMENKPLSVKEMVQMLEKLDREEKLQRERNDVKFKLESSTQDRD